MSKSNVVGLVVVIAILASLSAIGQPIVKAIGDNAAANRAYAEAAKIQAEVLLIQTKTISIIALSSYLIIVLLLLMIVVLLWQMTQTINKLSD